MVDLIAALGGGLFVLASIVVGSRLLARGLRSRELPELAMGAGLLLAAGLGYPMMMTAQLATGLPVAAREALLLAHMLCNLIGLGGIAYFTCRVFHAGRGWARIFFLSLVGLEGAALVMQIAGPGLMLFAESQGGPWQINTYVGMAILAWAGAESLIEFAAARRRVALGLTDPVVANRMLLWGIAMSSGASMSILSVGLDALGVPVMGTLAGALITGPLGLVAAGALWLAFMPPAAYLRSVTAAAARA